MTGLKFRALGGKASATTGGQGKALLPILELNWNRRSLRFFINRHQTVSLTTLRWRGDVPGRGRGLFRGRVDILFVR